MDINTFVTEGFPFCGNESFGIKELEPLRFPVVKTENLDFLFPLAIIPHLELVSDNVSVLTCSATENTEIFIGQEKDTAPLVEIIRKEIGTLTHQIKSFQLVHNPNLELQFKARLTALSKPNRHAAPWPELNFALRNAMKTRLDTHFHRIGGHIRSLSQRPISDGELQLMQNAGLDLAWHGLLLPDKIPSIREHGFINLSLRNLGFFGRGIYFTHNCENSTYYSGPDGCLILAWVLLGKTFPTPFRIDTTLWNGSLFPIDKRAGIDIQFQSGYPGHDSHYAIVNDDGRTVQPDADPLSGKFDEICIFQESNILPIAIIFKE